MATDIGDINAALATKIVGSDATGTEQTPVQSTTAGGLHVNLRNNSGTEVLPALETTQVANGVLLGPVTETAPTTDIASSGLNGRLQRIAQRLSSLIALIPSLNTIAWFSRISDGTNNAAVSPNLDLYTRDVLNTSGQYRAQSVTTSAAEALGAATILVNRKLLTITPTNGTVYWGFSNTVTSSTGTPIFKNQTAIFGVSANVHVYLISAGTVDCRIAEGS